MGNSGSSGGANRKARSLPNSPEAHRYRSRFNFSFSAFSLVLLLGQVKTGLFRLQIFESFSTRLPLIFHREFPSRSDEKRNDAFKHLDSSFRARCFLSIKRLRIKLCGIQLSRRAFCSKRILRSPGFHDLRRTAETYAMFCLVVSTSKYGLLRAIFITVSGSIVVEHKFRLGLDDEL